MCSLDLVVRSKLRFVKFQISNFFLLKLSLVCTFWIILMCWCQKWFLKNKKTSLACISAQKAIWKATATTLPNTLLGFVERGCNRSRSRAWVPKRISKCYLAKFLYLNVTTLPFSISLQKENWKVEANVLRFFNHLLFLINCSKPSRSFDPEEWCVQLWCCLVRVAIRTKGTGWRESRFWRRNPGWLGEAFLDWQQASFENHGH